MAVPIVKVVNPPLVVAPLADDGEHSQPWAQHHQAVADEINKLIADPGTIAADNAGPGVVGEFVSVRRLVGAAVGLVTNTAADVVAVTIAPGDWDIWGTVVLFPGGATTCDAVSVWFSTGSATLPGDIGDGSVFSLQAQFKAGAI